MNYPQIILKPGREKSLFFRHPWIFSGGLSKIPSEIKDGDIVDILDYKGNFQARGYYNSQSNIAIRILTFENSESIDQSFLENRFKLAAEKRVYLHKKNTNAYRLIFAEGDNLPGLIVDKYADFFVVQIHTLGMDKMRDQIVQVLIKLFKPRAIFERSDLGVRKKEGLLTMPKGLLYGDFSGEFVEIKENGVKFLVDIENGQKTGFFLDQRENRLSLKDYVAGKRVLNLFSYSGGFSCYALSFGAKHVTSVDISQYAIDLCRKNIALNFSEDVSGIIKDSQENFGKDSIDDKHTEIVQGTFEYLQHALEKKEKFDVVIVDPPAFAKSQKKIHNAINAYIKLNEAALRVLAPGGIFITSSCSGFITQEMFRSVLFQAQLRVQTSESCDLSLLEQKIQPSDHPLRVSFPEGEYLKFLVLKKN